MLKDFPEPMWPGIYVLREASARHKAMREQTELITAERARKDQEAAQAKENEQRDKKVHGHFNKALLESIPPGIDRTRV